MDAFHPFRGANRTSIILWLAHFEVQQFILAKRLMKDAAKLFLDLESRAYGVPEPTHIKNFMYEATTIREFKEKIKAYEIMTSKNLDQYQVAGVQVYKFIRSGNDLINKCK